MVNYILVEDKKVANLILDAECNQALEDPVKVMGRDNFIQELKYHFSKCNPIKLTIIVMAIPLINAELMHRANISANAIKIPHFEYIVLCRRDFYEYVNKTALCLIRQIPPRLILIHFAYGSY
jgi:hypothetical protein